ncbi:hypothetical protein AX17_002529 [Amanita inopinata Kibby_2008]|nr:hypothetical protein AX17_002529 [Amanita inopinata Kibby_2008]
MAAKAPVLSSAHPPLGTLIDGGSLELVEVLGIGGYGVVYRAVDVRIPYPQSYAVKCLMHSPSRSQNRRNLHIREIALHQIASGHQGVVTLHKVVQDYDYTYIIMDYAPDHDLFTQILNNRRYLGDDVIIKHIFLQLLDAVEYIHSLGIYHRDLKPENILCFDGGYHVALTDFGLATTDKTSSEFRTGSIYHMSPECQGGGFSPTGVYSPRFNDIWSLGIILLNLATGRNPWKSATASDPTFQAYLCGPHNFLPTVLPISPELNEILMHVLEIDWRKRMTLRQLRRAIEDLDSFYSDDVVFEGSLARCPWEVGYDLHENSDDSYARRNVDFSTKHDGPREERAKLRSCWSEDTDDESEIVFAATTSMQDPFRSAPWSPMVAEHGIGGPHWLAETLGLSEHKIEGTHGFSRYGDDESSPPTTYSPTSPCLSSESSSPATPDSTNLLMGSIQRRARFVPRQKLTIDTTFAPKPHYYNANDSEKFTASPDEMSPMSSTSSCMMHTAVDHISYSSFYATSPKGSDVSLQTPQSISLSAVTPGIKDLTSPAPWNISTAVPIEAAVASTKVMFSSDHASTEESFQPAVSDIGASSYAIENGTAVIPRDYVWPDFCGSAGEDWGGGRSGQISYISFDDRVQGINEDQEPSGREPRTFDSTRCLSRMVSRASYSTIMHMKFTHGRHPSEPLMRGGVDFVKQQSRAGFRVQFC